jgi:Fe-S cluster assembly ATPase SufC
VERRNVMKFSNGYVRAKIILDETDSGLDIDALRIVSNGVNKLKSDKNAIIVITLSKITGSYRS